jgi:ribosomal protein RSM22 (predicted rRNA methylase)
MPAELRARLDELAASVGLARLSAAAARLSTRYRETGRPAETMTDVDAAAYAVFRMPATYAALRAALGQVTAVDPRLRPRTVVDLGAGTGAALWAVRDVFGPGQTIRAIERDAAMVAVGRRLAPPGVEWVRGDLRGADMTADLSIAGYALGETSEPDSVVTAMAAAETVLVVEPGTPRGYATVLAARDALVGAGMRVAAPCPQSGACPLAVPDWCHFSVRLLRTPALRHLKGGVLGYEDEKFSFVAATRTSVPAVPGRILRHPRRRGGHVVLRVCGADGTVTDPVVSRRAGAVYRAARKAQWGDAWPPRDD